MGQARLRGTKEERTAVAVAKVQAERAERQRKRDEAERAENERIAAIWREMTPEQREQALKRAKQDAENLSYLSGVFGPTLARVITSMDRDKGKRTLIVGT